MLPFLRFPKRRRGKLNGSPPNAAAPAPTSCDLAMRIGWFRATFDHSDDFKLHEVQLPGEIACAFLYIDNIIDLTVLQEQVIAPLLLEERFDSPDRLVSHVADQGQIPVAGMKTVTDLRLATDALFEGTVVMLVHNEPRMLLFPLRKVEKRQIAGSENENVIRGPKAAFVEDLATNMTMVRRIIKHPDLKMEHRQFGKYTNTNVTLCYIEGICEKKLLDEVKERLSRIDIDGILGSSYIEDFIEDNPYSPFPQCQYTERPDTFSAALLEGRVGIMVDGTPLPIIVPVTLYMLLQSAEDYYQRFVAATWIRWIRYLFLLISFLLPSIYIAVTTFHPEMLPPNLLIAVAAARENVPFPAIVEALIMEITFEALREAGIRIPKPIGQTVSIIGALVIGQSAVQAGIVSAPMVIVVSITGIASFIIPHFDLGLTFRLLRFPVMFLATSFGLYGIIIAIILIYIHLVSLRSFGMPYLSPTAPLVTSDLKDVLVRAPHWLMKNRPMLYGTTNRQRLGSRSRLPIQHDDGD